MLYFKIKKIALHDVLGREHVSSIDIALFPGSGEEPENKASVDNDI